MQTTYEKLYITELYITVDRTYLSVTTVPASHHCVQDMRVQMWEFYYVLYIAGLMQERRNSSALAMFYAKGYVTGPESL